MIYGFGPYGFGPYGLPDGGLPDLSVPNPLSALLREPLLRRSYVFIGSPCDLSIAEKTTIKWSTDAYASDAGDTLPDGTAMPHALFRAALVTAYNAQAAVMSNGDFAVSAPSEDLSAPGGPTTQGDLIFELATGRFLDALALQWDAAEALILMGRPEWQLKQFAPIFHGVSGPIISADPLEAHLPLADNSYQLMRPVQPATYRGMSAAFRGDGAATYVSGTLPCPTGAMTIEMWVRPRTTASTQKDLAGWRAGGFGPGKRILLFANTGGNLPTFRVCNDLGTDFGVVSPVPIAAGAMRHMAGILNPATGITLLVDGAVVGTASVSGTFNTVLSSFVLLKEPDTSSLFADCDIDEVKISNVARSVDDIVADMSRQVPADSPWLAAYFPIDEGTGGTIFDVTPGAHNLTVTGLLSTSWVGTLEGGPEIAGQAPPVWEGVARQVQPVPVDAQNYVYEVARGPVALAISEAADKGDPVYTVDSPVTDIYAAPPAAGHCTVAYMDGRTLVRLGAAPQGMLTLTVTGDVLDTAGLVKKYAKSYAGWTDSQLDLVAFARVGADHPEPVQSGRRSPSSGDTIWGLMQELALAAGGWVTMTRAGLLTIYILEDPSTKSPKFALTETDVRSTAVAISARTLAVKRVRLAYRPYDQVQQPGNLATSLSQSTILDLGQKSRYTQTPVDPAVLKARPRALDREDASLYDQEADAHAEALRRQGLWGVDRVTHTLPLTRGLFQYGIGDIISVTIVGPDGEYVHGLNGWQAVVVGFTEDPKLDSISLEAWGATPPQPAVRVVDDGSERVADDGSVRIADS